MAKSCSGCSQTARLDRFWFESSMAIPPRDRSQSNAGLDVIVRQQMPLRGAVEDGDFGCRDGFRRTNVHPHALETQATKALSRDRLVEQG